MRIRIHWTNKTETGEFDDSMELEGSLAYLKVQAEKEVAARNGFLPWSEILEEDI